MYAEALSEILSYTAGSAAASAIGRLVEGEPDDAAMGVVERAELEDARKNRIVLTVAMVVALVLSFSLLRRR